MATSSPSDTVCGVLWELEQQHQATLDDQEGVGKGLYRRFSVRVDLLNRPEVVTREAITYQVTDEHLTPEGEEENRPSGVYKKVMVEGAREQKLPQDYVEK